MSFIELPGLADVQEPTLAPEGEYGLTIAHAEFYQNDKGSNLIKCSIAFDGHPDYANFNHWVVLSAKDDDDDRRKKRVLNVKRFLHLFSVPTDGDSFEVENFFGASTIANVGQTEVDEKGNTYNELYVPRIQGE